LVGGFRVETGVGLKGSVEGTAKKFDDRGGGEGEKPGKNSWNGDP